MMLLAILYSVLHFLKNEVLRVPISTPADGAVQTIPELDFLGQPPANTQSSAQRGALKTMALAPRLLVKWREL